MSGVKRFSVSVEPSILEEFDAVTSQSGLSRSSAVEAAMRSFLAEHKWSASEQGDVAGALTMIYDHHGGVVEESVSGVPVDGKVVIDFSGIAFASRAFCHELVRGLGGRRVTFKNMGPEVDAMMRLARVKSRIKSRNSFIYRNLEIDSR